MITANQQKKSVSELIFNIINYNFIGMLAIYRILPQVFNSTSRLFSTIKSTSNFTQYQVTDIKNSHLLYLKDPGASLPFMSEVTTDKGQKGVVIKLGDLSTTVIGMYNSVEPRQKIIIANANTNKISQKLRPQFNNIYDVNLQSIAAFKDVQANKKLANKIQVEGKRQRIQSLSPLISVCHDIFVGNFITFSGPLGSARTTNAIELLQCFTNSNIYEPIGIYLNTNSHDSIQTCGKAAKKYRTLAFSRANSPSNVNNNQMKNTFSSVGVCMLAVKCLKMAQRLKKQGNNVMLVVDNIHEIISNQWTILQNLNLSISPFNILNQLYAASSEGQLGKLANGPGNKKIGSMTSIVISSSENQEVMQEYTTLGNNSKHLKTLGAEIRHPLQMSINNTKIGSSKLKDAMRSKINQLLREKSQKQILTKLKLMRDEPWQHYYLLDSQWWAQALKNYQPQSFDDRNLLLWFIKTNINEDYCAHWKISCLEAYNKYLNFLQRPQDLNLGRDVAQFQNFIQLCKMQNIFDVFKKDYLN